MAMRDTALVLLDRTDDHVADEVRGLVATPGDATIRDLHFWRVGPEAHAAIVSVVPAQGMIGETVRTRLVLVHELADPTAEMR